MTRLDELTTEGALRAAGRGAVLAVPVGSTEQHGPHLPLSTDTDIAEAMCARLAACRDVVVAPALAYGSSGEHEGFAGTISIGQAAVELMLLELCRSATRTFHRIILISAHGGNAGPVARAVDTLRLEGRDVMAWSPRWDGDAHAGHSETSMQLVVRSRSVDMSRAEPGDTRALDQVLPVLVRDGVRAVSPNGVLGDPSTASRAEGITLLDRLVRDLVAAFDAWRASVTA